MGPTYTVPVLGCTDTLALNYEVLATEDDGSCEYPITSQTIIFPQGWSTFSTYMVNENMLVDDLLSPILENIVIVKNYLGSAYIPEWDFNGIGDVMIGQGYPIKMRASDNLIITGDYALPELHPIQLLQGWNNVGYLRINPTNAINVFSEIVSIGNLIIAKDYLGNAYLPEWNFNGIGMMEPGKGYQIKVFEEDTLQYLSNQENYRKSIEMMVESKVKYFPKPKITGENMHLVIPNTSWETLPAKGDEIAAFDKHGTLICSGVYSNPATVLTLWGDDITTKSKDGLLSAEMPTFKLWDSQNNKETTIDLRMGYEADAVTVLTDRISLNNTKNNAYQFEISPNPTSSKTMIQFFIPQQEKVKISIFNILGEFIDFAINTTLQKGVHNVKLDVVNLEAGTYFLKMESGRSEQVKSLVVFH